MKIEYESDGERGGFSLSQRDGGNWILEEWSIMQGGRSGRKTLVHSEISVTDAEDMGTPINENPLSLSKSEYIRECGREIRCLRRGHIVQ